MIAHTLRPSGLWLPANAMNFARSPILGATGLPLVIFDGESNRPASAESGSACSCCECPAPYPPPPGWASVVPSVSGCQDGGTVTVTLTDTSVPPEGYCWNSTQWNVPATWSFVGLSNGGRTGTWTVGGSRVDCAQVSFGSHATLCGDVTKCNISDGYTFEISLNACCCYGGNCVNGVPTINPPGSITVTINEFEAIGTTPPAEELAGWINGILPGTAVVPLDETFADHATYFQELSHTNSSDGQQFHLYFLGSVYCDGNLAVGQVAWNAVVAGGPNHPLYAHNKGCHGSFEDSDFTQSGGGYPTGFGNNYSWNWKGIRVGW